MTPFFSAQQQEYKRFLVVIKRINDLESEYEYLSDDALRAKTEEFKNKFESLVNSYKGEEARLRAEQQMLEQILPDAFAAIREASKRTTGLRHNDVQLIGGIMLHLGQVCELQRGEGKDLVS